MKWVKGSKVSTPNYKININLFYNNKINKSRDVVYSTVTIVHDTVWHI